MKRVRVFKTDVDRRSRADAILEEIRCALPGSDPSFDLEDRDNVLRVEDGTAEIDAPVIRRILHRHGFRMEPSPDLASPWFEPQIKEPATPSPR